ncbi:DUF4272 domain-containing protein [Polyangium jinanense]|uniref:DUF4272 domain-containing protein n=1 Tax=Polyangium jinanense TaxID=2829994 RepID=A0A9X4AQA0_9BACT|nr:DUF4272 domain-containing protein [Polyangium jinanense]MDC3954581.1 DUF4272 domain-containing protein [Polyangium jinanense]MDC3980884.1 DUF4272 domain-containing protein [Polyangium jinanense]
MIRQRSLFMARRLGYPVDVSLPLITDRGVLRDKDEVVDRMLALDAVIACASGMPPEIALEWVSEIGITGSLSPSEARVLEGRAEEVPAGLLDRMEALWALGWSASLFRALDFSRICGPELGMIFGELDDARDVRALRKRSRLRRHEEVLAACDLARCLHRGIEIAARKRMSLPGKVQPNVILERRKALEWLLGEEEWDEVFVGV